MQNTVFLSTSALLLQYFLKIFDNCYCISQKKYRYLHTRF